MTPDDATTLCLTGVAFIAAGWLTRLFASYPLLVVRCLTGRQLRRTPHAWNTSAWRQGMRGISWLQFALGLAMFVLGGGWCVVRVL